MIQQVEKPQIDAVAFPIDAFDFNPESGMLYLKDGWDLNISQSLWIGGSVGISGAFSGGSYSGGSIEVDGEDYVITDTNGILFVFVITGAADRTMTLPTVADNTGRFLIFVKTDDGAGKVVLDGEGGETINGAATDNSMANQYDTISIVSDGSEWFKI
jgi:hypothetical protein